jgi:signal transduction histidine kinase
LATVANLYRNGPLWATFGPKNLRVLLITAGFKSRRGRCVETSRPSIDERQHELSVSAPAEMVWLNADPTRLEEVLVNLLTNAAKYTDRGGRIWLTAEREGNQAVIRVRDTGIGIEPELLRHIFEMFTQSQRGLARSDGGLGIGLSVASNLVQMHGGTLEARSEGHDKGSEFIARLPIDDSDPGLS